MKKTYKAVKVSKTLSRELVYEVLDSLQMNFGPDLLQDDTDNIILDKLSRSVYNRLRRQASAEKLDVT